MSIIRLCVAVFFCVSAAWGVPRRSISNGAPSGAGEIPDELPPDYRPFDPSLGKGFPSNYDLDPEGGIPLMPEYDVNDIDSHGHPHGEEPDRPLDPDDRFPDEDHPGKEPEEEDAHEPPSHENPEGGEDDVDAEEESKTQEGEEEKPDASDEEDEKKLHGDEEETEEGGDDVPLPFNTALFSFQQVNHYIKQLEKAMEEVFKESLDEAALLNNTFANTTEEEVEVDGHKYKVQKSILKTGYDDKNSSLFIEAVSSVGEEVPEKERKERSNPDSEPVQ